jgi:hypothetical protein
LLIGYDEHHVSKKDEKGVVGVKKKQRELRHEASISKID